MTRAVWDDLGSRLYHAGVDRGMLYIDEDETLVPWSFVTDGTPLFDGYFIIPDGLASKVLIGETFVTSLTDGKVLTATSKVSAFGFTNVFYSPPAGAVISAPAVVTQVTPASGISWSGLVSVTEAPTGGDGQPYYIDGQKVLNIPAGEDFLATIEAYAAPLEFAPCAGRLYLSTGLFAADQPKKPFSFSYRTLIGNDSDGLSFAYKIHIVYNALANIKDFTHGTDNANPSANTHSWDITTVPASVTGYRPMAHFVFDTRVNTDLAVSEVEDILYGNSTSDPRLPAVDELISLLAYQEVAWWNLTGLSSFPSGASSGDDGVDFSTGNMYADDRVIPSAFWWDITGLSDFPAEALVGDWGLDTITGDVFKKTA